MLTPQWIARATKGKLIRGHPAAIGGFAVDSRRLQPGQVFVALKGLRHDGHDFLEEAFARGASCAVVERGEPRNAHANLVCVPDTQAALQQLARAYRLLFQTPMIGVTGSVGKTTTKELLGRLLATRFNTYHSPGNFNNEIGMPLSLLNMPFGTQLGVFEVATQRPGELKPLADLLGPSVGLITAIADAHRGAFGSDEELLKEKWALVDALPLAGGIVVLNADDPRLWSRTTNQRFRVDFGINRRAASYRAEDIEDRGLDGLSFTLIHPGGRAPIHTRLLGRHNVYNILAATALAMEMRVDAEAVQRVVAQIESPPHRMERKPSRLGIILDDCYNASPSAVKAALSTFSQMNSSKNKVFVFGDMLELGDNAVGFHRQVAGWVTDANIRQVFTVGELAAETARALQKQHGWSTQQVQTARSLAELKSCLNNTLKDEENLILVKGSRSLSLDQLVDQLGLPAHTPQV